MGLTKAIRFAARCHKGQKRKGTDIPYIVHPMEACAIAATMTNDPDVLMTAVLHDVMEDCGIPVHELTERFGARVAMLVASESEKKEADERGSWRKRKEATIARLESASREEKILTLSDKLSNLRAISRDEEESGEALWQRFNQNDKSQHAWYYRLIRGRLQDLCQTFAYREYDSLVDKVFGKE